jgi:hypothetical protein
MAFAHSTVCYLKINKKINSQALLLASVNELKELILKIFRLCKMHVMKIALFFWN